MEFLNQIATKPEFVVPTTFDELPSLGQNVSNESCKLIETIQKPVQCVPKFTQEKCVEI